MQASEPLAELLKLAEAESEAGSKKRSAGPPLAELFYVGQLVRGTVIDLQEVPPYKAPTSLLAMSRAAPLPQAPAPTCGEKPYRKQRHCACASSVPGKSSTQTCLPAQGGEGKTKKKRISLSLHVGRINSGLSAAALTPGLALPAAVKSVEDHGYTLFFGIKVCMWPVKVLRVCPLCYYIRMWILPSRELFRHC